LGALLARPLREKDDYFQIESIPFYLKNISRADVVEARVVKNDKLSEGEAFQFNLVIDRGGHKGKWEDEYYSTCYRRIALPSWSL
jgi:hypothetical protein